jgi:hypothetical protein
VDGYGERRICLLQTYNFVAVRDEVVCRAEAYASVFYEATGAFGVRQRVKNLRNYVVDADHGEIVTVPFLRKYVLPIIDGRGLPKERNVTRPFDHKIIWRMRLAFIISSLLIIAGGLLAVFKFGM